MFENLEIRDYIIGDLIIEKISKDFIASVFDRRIFQQANKIASFTNKAILLSEGLLQNNLMFLFTIFINFSSCFTNCTFSFLSKSIWWNFYSINT